MLSLPRAFTGTWRAMSRIGIRSVTSQVSNACSIRVDVDPGRRGSSRDQRPEAAGRVERPLPRRARATQSIDVGRVLSICVDQNI
jgi:hypothetical protein